MAWTTAVSGNQPTGGEEGAVRVYSEEALNNSDKTLDFDTDIDGYLFRVDLIRVEFTASATVGNRALGYNVLDAGGDVLHQVAYPTLVTAIQAPILQFAAFATNGLASTPIEVRTPPVLYLGAGMTVRIFDAAAIDAAADDMIVHVSGLFWPKRHAAAPADGPFPAYG